METKITTERFFIEPYFSPEGNGTKVSLWFVNDRFSIEPLKVFTNKPDAEKYLKAKQA